MTSPRSKAQSSFIDLFYLLKPIIPRRTQLFIRKKIVAQKRRACESVWPIDPNAAQPPSGWTGWPDGKKFALVLTHDVERQQGLDNCLNLMALEQDLGFRSSFNFVPERDYVVPPEYRRHLRENGFEVGVHDLKHDGKLYKSEAIFKNRAKRINYYLKEWGCSGFRSGAMHHNLEWLNNLDIDYDSSTFDTDPFEPQPDGMGTIFPFSVNLAPFKKTYIELPYTLPQDSTLFLVMGEKDISIWIKKLEWIAEHGGMALVITHPDYMSFGDRRAGLTKYPIQLYSDLLKHIQSRYAEQFWHVLPRQIASFWKEFERKQASNQDK